jgi:protein-S-isoprenylcysteine O-methyltransferase Ste14
MNKFRLFIFRNRSLNFLPFAFLLFFNREKLPFENTLDAIGIFFMVAGEFLRIWSNCYTESRLTRSIFLQAERLVTAGPYAYTRNPIYLGNFLLGLGLSLLSGVLWLIIFYPLFFAFIYYQIIRLEEEFLSERFKEGFNEYKKNVPRFFPKFKAYEKQNGEFYFEFFKSKEYQTIVLFVILSVIFEYFI